MNVSKISSKSRVQIIIFSLILTLAGETFIRFIYEVLLNLPEIEFSDQSLKSESNYWVKGFFILFLAPILETIFFQTFLIGFLSRFIPLKACFLISVISFGASHFYTISYMIGALYMGCVLSLAYIIFYDKRQSPTFNTIIIHGLRNLIALIAMYLDP